MDGAFGVGAASPRKGGSLSFGMRFPWGTRRHVQDGAQVAKKSEGAARHC
ncbi:unnamed protein product [marine sediment metagenome]|uniref:Uncharacterized protein n=1 Tax=marine sediment metagenome TaxID=412755 RepID=X1TGC8_9ZZZZ